MKENRDNYKFIDEYACDCGSLLITDTTNKTGVLLANGVGDVIADIYKTREVGYDTPPLDEWEYITTVYGNFNIHTYDCLNENGEMYDIDHPIMVKAKRTAFYRAKDGTGDMLYQVWEV